MDLAILQSIERLSESFKLNFNLSKEEILPSYIHNLRVSVKRIRAFIRMNKEINQESLLKKGSIKYLRKIFKGAASLRDLHIISVIISEYFPLLKEKKEFVNFFKKQENKAKREYLRTIKLGKKAFADLDNIKSLFNKEVSLRSYDNNKVDSLIKSRLLMIKDIISGNLDDHTFHKFRIKLKELNHIMVMRNDSSKIQILEQLHSIARLLGVWHDHIIFLDFYQRFLNSKRKLRQNNELSFLYDTDFEYCSVEKQRIISDTKKIFETLF